MADITFGVAADDGYGAEREDRQQHDRGLEHDVLLARLPAGTKGGMATADNPQQRDRFTARSCKRRAALVLAVPRRTGQTV